MERVVPLFLLRRTLMFILLFIIFHFLFQYEFKQICLDFYEIGVGVLVIGGVSDSGASF